VRKTMVLHASEGLVKTPRADQDHKVPIEEYLGRSEDAFSRCQSKVADS
jgi:hypothetical protein